MFLVEITAYTSSAGTSVLRYSSGEGLVTGPSETPANTVYEPRLKNPGNFQRFLYRKYATGGASEIGKGNVILNNADGELDVLLDYGFDGRQIVIRSGPDAGGDYPADFPVLYTATMEQVEFNWTEVTIRLRDRQAEVANKYVVEDKFLGTNILPAGVEGTADDYKGDFKPFLYGTVYNIPVPCVNTSRLIYQISNRTIQSIAAVYDKGASVTPGTSRASLALLQSNTPTAATFDYYLGSASDGAYIRLGSTPAGDITVDASQGANAAARTVGRIVWQLLTGPGEVLTPYVDQHSLEALDLDNDSEVGIWADVGGMTVGEALDEVTRSIGAWWSVDRSGVFFVGRLEDPSGLTGVLTFDDWQILKTVQRIASRNQDKGVPTWRVTVDYKRNYLVQDQASVAGVAIARLTFLKQKFRSAVGTDSDVLLQHLLSPEMRVETALILEADAQAEANRLLSLYKTRRDFLEFEIPLDQLDDVDLGEVVGLSIDRFDWSPSKSFVVIGMVEDYLRNSVTLQVFG